MIENLQRQDLNPIEEALGFERLIRQFGMTQETVAEGVGKDRATVSNTLRLLRLPAAIQEDLAAGRLTLGAARPLLALGLEKAQLALAQRIIQEGLSVRRIEELVRGSRASTPKSLASKQARDPHLVAAEQKLQRSLGTQVDIVHRKSRGWIRIAYFSLKDLDRLMGRLT